MKNSFYSLLSVVSAFFSNYLCSATDQVQFEKKKRDKEREKKKMKLALQKKNKIIIIKEKTASQSKIEIETFQKMICLRVCGIFFIFAEQQREVMVNNGKNKKKGTVFFLICKTKLKLQDH